MVKRTLQEIANFFDMAVARDMSKEWCLHEFQPYADETRGLWSSNGEIIELDFDDYSGDWRESLTLPDSWPKFKHGELVIEKATGAFAKWSYGATDEELWRRPTKEEWKILRGE